MAALQKIRNYGGLLIGAIGLALFAFIAEEFFRSIETTSAVNKQQVGEVYGEKLSVQDYQNLVEEYSEMVKLQRAMQGQSDNLSDSEMEQLRSQVWEQYVRNSVIAREASKAGIIVTDKDVQNALAAGRYQSLQVLSRIFPSPQGGLNIQALQEFMKNKDKQLAQARQQGNESAAEQIEQIVRLWDFSQQQLRKELLEMKYYGLLQMCCVGNPVSAQLQFNDRNETATAEVVALPYSKIDDKEVAVSDADIKAMYQQYKELFRLPQETRDIKVIDVQVTASAKDKAALTANVKAVEERLRAGEDPAAVVGSSKSVVAYVDLPLRKEAFARMADVAARLDSVAVGSVVPTYYNQQDNTINTLKLIAKVQAPDSVLYRRIVAVADTPEKSKVLADSIASALRAGGNVAEIAKKYQQTSDSMWLASAAYEGQQMDAATVKMLDKLNGMSAGATEVYTAENSLSLVLQVLDRKHIVTKYNVAVVKCENAFSKETYNNELSKFNKFLSANTTLEAIEKNAGKNGYIVRDIPNFASNSSQLEQSIGGTKDAVRWVFDEAEKGEISRLFECGSQKDHLLLVGLKDVHEKGYMPWDNEQVKNVLSTLVRQQKKGEKLLAQAKDVKDIKQAKGLKGAETDTLANVSFSGNAMVKAVGVNEPKLAGALAAAKSGSFVKPFAGAAAVYMAQVQSKGKGADKFDAVAEVQQAAQRAFSFIYTRSFYGGSETLIEALKKDAEVVDNRYKF